MKFGSLILLVILLSAPYKLFAEVSGNTCLNPLPKLTYPRDGATVKTGKFSPYTEYLNPLPVNVPPCTIRIELNTYRIQNGDYVQTGTSFDLTSAPLGQYQLTAYQTLYSGQTVSVTVSFTLVDKSAPVIEQIYPPANFELYGNAKFQVFANDPSGIKYVRFYLGKPQSTLQEMTLVTEDTEYPYEVEIDTRTLPEGMIRLQIIAADNLNNYISSNYSDYLINNDNKIPTVFFYDKTERIVSGTEKLHVYIHDPDRMDNAQFYVDGKRIQTTTDILFRNLEIDTTQFPDGKHFITAVVTDSRNVSAQATIVLEFKNYADEKDPFVEVTSHKQGQTIKEHALITVNALDESGIDRVEFSFGSQPLGIATQEPFSAPINSFLYANAVYDLVITAYDRAGRFTKLTLFLAVQNDRSQPQESTLSISSPGDGAYVAGFAEISVLALDDVAFRDVKIFVNGELVSSLTLPPYKFFIDTKKYSDGAYSVTALGTDYSDNTREDTITLNISNNDLTKAKPNATVKDVDYKEKLQAAATLLNTQLSSLDFGKDKSAGEMERKMAIKGTIKSLNSVMKDNKKTINSDKSLSKINNLVKLAVKRLNNLLKSSEKKVFIKNKKTLMPLIRKLTKVLSEV